MSIDDIWQAAGLVTRQLEKGPISEQITFWLQLAEAATTEEQRYEAREIARLLSAASAKQLMFVASLFRRIDQPNQGDGE